MRFGLTHLAESFKNHFLHLPHILMINVIRCHHVIQIFVDIFVQALHPLENCPHFFEKVDQSFEIPLVCNDIL